MRTIRHIAVLIPARNEEVLLPRCIASLLRAKELLPDDIGCDVIIVVDSSRDRTYELAKRMLGTHGIVLTTNAGSVGVARGLAAQSALARFCGEPDSCWFANTDADCEVPKRWLLEQVLLADLDVDIVAGIVDVDDFSEHHSGVQQLFRETYQLHADGSHPHVHGANLGIRASAYQRAGGWSNLCTAEDHDLWNRAVACGYSKRSVVALKVLTSGRRVGRAPDGFAGALAVHNEVFA